MSVFSKLRGFLYRHRTKFVVGGVVVTGKYPPFNCTVIRSKNTLNLGTLFLMKYAQARLREWHEKEAMEFIERNRKQTHFENINRTCNQTVLNLSSSLLDTVYQIINTDDTIDKLKLSPENKLEIWGQLKVCSNLNLFIFVICQL